MMPPRASFVDTSELARQLSEHLDSYDFEAGDCIVPLGDPVIIATACALLGVISHCMRVLRWDRNLGKYLPVVVDLSCFG